jgi:hypothetical protein
VVEVRTGGIIEIMKIFDKINQYNWLKILLYCILFIIVSLLVIVSFGSTKQKRYIKENSDNSLNSLPKDITLSGNYVCLPHINELKSSSTDCVFGLKTDNGEYYMVNFGAGASAMPEFQSGKHITAKGFVVIKEALSTDQWVNFNMKWIFTITERY